MKHILVLISLLICLVPFSSYAKNNPAPAPAAAPGKVITGSSWTLTLPNDDWQAFQQPEGSHIEVAFLNRQLHDMAMVIKEEFAGTQEQYVTAAVLSLVADGAKIKPVKKPVVINGATFTVVEGVRQGVRAWFWITTKDGFGYGFSCGGMETDQDVGALCVGIAKTFKLN